MPALCPFLWFNVINSCAIRMEPACWSRSGKIAVSKPMKMMDRPVAGADVEAAGHFRSTPINRHAQAPSARLKRTKADLFKSGRHVRFVPTSGPIRSDDIAKRDSNRNRRRRAPN
jgi:hypothetical protein